MRLWVRAALVLSVLFFVLGLTEDFEDPKAAAVRLCGLAVIATAAASWRTLGPFPWTLLDRAVVAWLGMEFLATVFARAPFLSLLGDSVQREGFTTSLAMAGLYLGARTGTRDRPDLQRTLEVAWVAITIASAYALFQAAGLDWIAWAPRVVGGVPIAQGRPAATLGHATVLGVASSAAGAAILARVLVPGRRRGRWALAGAICVAATLVTLARAAWLGLAAGGLAAAVLLFMAGEKPGMSRRAVLAGCGLVALIAVAVLASGWGERLAARFGDLLHPERGSGGSRIEIWRSALDAWRARPWLGWGPDSFGMVFSRFQTAALWRNEWGIVPFHAHSIYLQTLATRGLLGFASAAFWAVALLVTAREVWRCPEDRGAVAVSLAILAALAVAGAFGALGIAGQSLIVVASGMLSARAAPADPRPLPWAGVRAGVLAAGVAALWATADLTASAAAARSQGWLEQVASPDGRAAGAASERALVAARRAAAFAPGDDRVARLHADALFAAADVSTRPVPLLLEATREARRAIRLASERSENHLRLGRILGARVAMGDRASLAEARATLERVERLAPADALLLNECARFYLIMGDTDRALALARRTTLLYPDDGPSQAMLGRALARAGDRGAAVAALRGALAGQWHGDLGAREEAARELVRLDR